MAEESIKTWEPIRNRTFGSAQLGEFLVALHPKLPQGTLAAGLGYAFANRRPDTPLPPLPIKAVAAIPMTTRIDGVLPVTVPVSESIDWICSEFLKHVFQAGLETPRPASAAEAALKQDLALCFFALLHGWSLKVESGLEIRLQIEQPATTDSTFGISTLALRGYLPFGGRVTVFYSRLDADKFTTLTPLATECASRLAAERSTSGHLQLVPD